MPQILNPSTAKNKCLFITTTTLNLFCLMSVSLFLQFGPLFPAPPAQGATGLIPLEETPNYTLLGSKISKYLS
jgi:hypothetical protein